MEEVWPLHLLNIPRIPGFFASFKTNLSMSSSTFSKRLIQKLYWVWSAAYGNVTTVNSRWKIQKQLFPLGAGLFNSSMVLPFWSSEYSPGNLITNFDAKLLLSVLWEKEANLIWSHPFPSVVLVYSRGK